MQKNRESDEKRVGDVKRVRFAILAGESNLSFQIMRQSPSHNPVTYSQCLHKNWFFLPLRQNKYRTMMEKKFK
jgi:hypothetical protein